MKKTSDLIWQDKQHQVLFELIDKIKDEETDMSIFAQLINYTENHFSVEETYMEMLEYPRAEEHIRAHDKFRRELTIMVEEQLSLDAALRQSLSLFLREWLRRHVFGIDKDFEQFVLASEFK